MLIALRNLFSKSLLTACLVAVTTVCVDSSAPGQCVHTALVVPAVRGRVVAQLNSGEVPLPDAVITLYRATIRTVVKRTSSSSTGDFQIGNVPRGRYILQVTLPHLHDYYGELIVKRASSSGSSTPTLIVVTLGADFGSECGGSSAQIRNS